MARQARHEALYQAGDDLARQLIRGVSPLQIHPAATTAEREAVFQLRFAVTVEQGWADEQVLTAGHERDAFDDAALHLGLWDGDTLAGTIRLVFPQPGRLLPTEAVYGLSIAPQGRVVDASRIAIRDSYRGSSHRLLMALAAQAWLELRARGYHELTATATEQILTLLQQVGFALTPLAQPHRYGGEWRVPFRFDMLTTIRGLLAQWSPPRSES